MLYAFIILFSYYSSIQLLSCKFVIIKLLFCSVLNAVFSDLTAYPQECRLFLQLLPYLTPLFFYKSLLFQL